MTNKEPQIPAYKSFAEFRSLPNEEKRALAERAGFSTNSRVSLFGRDEIYRTWYEIYIRGYEPNQRIFLKQNPKRAKKMFSELGDREGLSLIEDSEMEQHDEKTKAKIKRLLSKYQEKEEAEYVWGQYEGLSMIDFDCALKAVRENRTPQGLELALNQHIQEQNESLMEACESCII
jgi:hypothetical protein